MAGSDILTGTPGTRPGILYGTGTGAGTGTGTELPIAGAFRTALRPIADDGALAGWFRDGTGQHGFVGSVSSYEQIDIAGASDTFVEGSNNARFLVGQYFNADGSTHAFIATPVATPGTLALLALGLGALAYARYMRGCRRGGTA